MVRRYPVCCWAGRKMDGWDSHLVIVTGRVWRPAKREVIISLRWSFCQTFKSATQYTLQGQIKKSLYTYADAGGGTGPVVDSCCEVTGVIYSVGLFWFNCVHLFVRRLALAQVNFSGGKKKVFFSQSRYFLAAHWGNTSAGVVTSPPLNRSLIMQSETRDRRRNTAPDS